MLRSLLLLAFSFGLAAAGIQAQQDTKTITDEEDARVSTVAARENAVKELLTAGNQLRDAGDKVKAARALNRAGRFQLQLSRPDEAIATYREALRILGGTRNTQVLVDTFNGLARAYKNSSKYSDAKPLLRRAVRLSEQNSYTEGKAEALLILPYCQSELSLALETAQKALDLWKQTNQKLGIARGYMVLGEFQMIQYQLIDSTRSYESAKALWTELNVPHQVAETLINLGFIEYRKGIWQASLSLYIQAQQLIVDEAAEPYMMGQITAGLAEAFIESGVPETGLTKYRESLKYHSLTNNPLDRIGTEWGIGRTHFFLGHYSEALAMLNTSRAEAASIENWMITGLSDDFLGRTYYAINDYPAALQHYEAAYEEFNRSNNPMEAARVVALMGQVYQTQGNFKAAKERYLRALARFRELSDQVNESATLYALGALELEQNSVDTAEEYLSQSINMTEKMRRFSISADLTAAFSAKVHDRYEKYIDCKMRKYFASRSEALEIDAFQTSELARARSLTELLRATQPNLFPGLDPKLAEREMTLRGYLHSNETSKITLLGKKYVTAELKSLEAESQRLKAEYDEVLNEIRKRNPSYEQVLSPTAWELPKIQQQVVTDDHTVLLEFSLGSEKSYLWTVTRSEIESYELPNEEQIDTLARRVHKLLSTPPMNGANNELSSAIQELSQMILSPAAGCLNNRRIIVVPDGILNYIPFQVLLAPSEPLIDNSEIINAPSASIFGELQQEAMHRQPTPRVLAAFGDPMFAGDYQVNNHADNEQVIATARLRSALRAAKLNEGAFDLSALNRLFHAKRELDSLREVAGENSLIVSEYDATRERFLSTDLSQFTILHVVTHGFFIPNHPENSGFVLSQINRDQQQLNGFVGIREIYGLRAPLLLVVLSACQTALGDNVRGEGLMSLPRGFMQAGASSVVASLWAVDDRATAELMKLFYSNMLQHGMKTGEALRAAQNSIRQQPGWQSPYYWAGFTLQGEYPHAIKPISETHIGASHTTIPIVSGSLLLVAALLWFWRRARARRVN
ncbi:MAG TPA: CHAT domain-containing tetratricopeptide repeat protein [Pyrinomonadaceae bacterium]